jgi:hypothetical protein
MLLAGRIICTKIVPTGRIRDMRYFPSDSMMRPPPVRGAGAPGL